MVDNKEIPITIEFGGGAEILFANTKKHKVVISHTESKWTMKDLLTWMKDNLLTGDPEQFLRGETIRPGIIVAVNDIDWELIGETNYEIKPNDNVLFISSLHGG